MTKEEMNQEARRLAASVGVRRHGSPREQLDAAEREISDALQRAYAEGQASVVALAANVLSMVDEHQMKVGRAAHMAVLEPERFARECVLREVLVQTNSLCVECGPNVRVDEDGCCVSCGGSATVAWLDSARAIPIEPKEEPAK